MKLILLKCAGDLKLNCHKVFSHVTLSRFESQWFECAGRRHDPLLGGIGLRLKIRKKWTQFSFSCVNCVPGHVFSSLFRPPTLISCSFTVPWAIGRHSVTFEKPYMMQYLKRIQSCRSLKKVKKISFWCWIISSLKSFNHCLFGFKWSRVSMLLRTDKQRALLEPSQTSYTLILKQKSNTVP